MDRSSHANAEDDLAIRALVARYCHAIAERDDTAWANTWSADGEWCVLGHSVRGREDILAHYQRIVSGFRWVLQVAANGLLEIAGDEARGRWLISETLQANDGRPVLNIGSYHDRYRRDPDGAWRFARREFRGSYMGPPDLSGTPRPPVR
jgi:uncharacterized protein (TIGR02246 family)